jgi:hypothetical protein
VSPGPPAGVGGRDRGRRGLVETIPVRRLLVVLVEDVRIFVLVLVVEILVLVPVSLRGAQSAAKRFVLAPETITIATNDLILSSKCEKQTYHDRPHVSDGGGWLGGGSTAVAGLRTGSSPPAIQSSSHCPKI